MCTTSDNQVDPGRLSCVVEVDSQSCISPLPLLKSQQGRELMDSHAWSEGPSTKLDFPDLFRSQVLKGELDGDHGGAVDMGVSGESSVDLHPPCNQLINQLLFLGRNKHGLTKGGGYVG